MAIFFLGVILCLLVSGVFTPHAVVSAARNSTIAITEAQLLQIAPTSRSCTNSTTSPFSECRTANQAVPLFNNALRKYNIGTVGEMAALISLIAYESSDFKYQKSYFPKEKGKGTRNMQSLRYNALYAFSITELWPFLEAYLNPDNASRMDGDSLLELVLISDEYDFASAAWFLTSQCDKYRTALERFDKEGWESYVTECLKSVVTDARRDYWDRARLTLGQP